MRKVHPVGKGSFARKVFRALGMDRGFEVPWAFKKEKPSVSENSTCSIQRELANAVLEAETSTVEGIMEYRRRSFPR
jgi:hypothetical protein